MNELIEKVIRTLAARAIEKDPPGTVDSLDSIANTAMKYSQAALNIVNAYNVWVVIQRERSRTDFKETG